MQEGVVCRDTRGWGKELICYVYCHYCVCELWSQLYSCCKLCDPSFIAKSINDCETRPLLLNVAQSRTSLPVITELRFDWNSAWYVFLKKGSSEPKLDPCRVAFSLPLDTALLPSDSLSCLRPTPDSLLSLLPSPDSLWCPLPAPWQRVVPASHCQEKNKNITFPGKSKNHGDS
jgi:hypothetical protein